MTAIDGPPSPEGFYDALGKYHAVWQSLDAVVDFSIGHFKKLSIQDGLAETRGRTFLSKLGTLRDLIEKSDRPDKDELAALISTIFKSKRNEIAHSYLATSDTQVAFIYRGDKSGGIAPCSLVFTGPQFIEHVATFVRAAVTFHMKLGFGAELAAFETEVVAQANANWQASA